MNEKQTRWFGGLIARMLEKRDLTREESKEGWRQILTNAQPELQQGAFIAAMVMKGETEEEITGSYEAIYEVDTNKVDLSHLEPLIDNCGTGMDSLKTFNISTAASIIAAASGAYLAKHGARAITSKCGTVDVLEQLGVDVDCDVETVKRSIEQVGIGIFNGMSAEVHPEGLFRILSQIRFGSTLNIAGSLANPARPTRAVRGVYSKDKVETTARVMRDMGFEKAIVFYGWNGDKTAGLDELSTLGESEVSELRSDGTIESYSVAPEDFGIARARFSQIKAAEDTKGSAELVVRTLSGRGDRAKVEIACLNAAPIIYLAGRAESLERGYQSARETVESGEALRKLGDWVISQNRAPDEGWRRLEQLVAAV